MTGSKSDIAFVSVRLNSSDSEWVNHWASQTGQDKASIARCGLRIVRQLTMSMQFADAVSLIAKIANADCPMDAGDLREIGTEIARLIQNRKGKPA